MGFNDWVEANKRGSEKDLARRAKLADAKADRAVAKRDAHLAQFSAKTETFEGVTLSSSSVSYQGHSGSVAGAHASVEAAADVRRRVTATRVLAVGVFALAAKKQTGSVYLTVQLDDGHEFLVEVPVKKETEARRFAAKINSAAH